MFKSEDLVFLKGLKVAKPEEVGLSPESDQPELLGLAPQEVDDLALRSAHPVRSRGHLHLTARGLVVLYIKHWGGMDPV